MKCSSQSSAVRIAVLFILLIAVIAGLAVYWTFYRVVPSLEGNIAIPELQNEVLVNWDSYQVPHIIANQETDLYLVMGYLHARDRLWQMTRQQYKLEGLHSREIGEAMLDMDRFYLTLSFGRAAKDAYANLPGQQKELLQSYANGVNAFVREHHRHLPPEFALSDVKPLEWEPWHSVGVLILWNWEHQQAFWSKPALSALHFVRDDTITSALTGLDVPGEVLFGIGEPSLEKPVWQALLDDYHLFSSPAAPLNSGFTGTGLAMASQGDGPPGFLFHSRESLLTLPDQGYEMVLQSNQGWRSGTTLPGLPVLLSGQNQYMAWAIMPLVSDDGDFYTGRLFHEDPSLPVQWELDPDILSLLDESLSVERHILSLKNGDEKQILLKRANHMPVVAISEKHNRFLAFDWTGLRYPADIGELMNLSRTRNPDQLNLFTESLSMPAIQVLFVTTDGQTGRFTGGRLFTDPYPLRIKDIQSFNRPHSSAPASQIVPNRQHLYGNPVTFLDRVPSSRIAVAGKCLYAPPWERSDRFLQLLDRTASDRLIPALTLQWHNDTYSSFAADLTPLITGSLETESRSFNPDLPADHIIPYFNNWNYEFGTNETAATLFQLFFKHAAINLYTPWLSERETDMLFRTPNVTYSAVSRLLADPMLWPGSHPYTYQEWIAKSINETAGHLSAGFGHEPYDWQWNRVVRAEFSPVLFDETRRNSHPARLAEKNLFQPPQIVVSGAPHSINAMHPAHNHPVTAAGATTMKRIMLVQTQQASYSILSTGQSGNLFSDHYHDQFELWNQGLMKMPVPLPPAQTDNITHTQRFRP